MSYRPQTGIPVLDNMNLLTFALFAGVKVSTRKGLVDLSQLATLPIVSDNENALTLREIESTYKGLMSMTLQKVEAKHKNNAASNEDPNRLEIERIESVSMLSTYGLALEVILEIIRIKSMFLPSKG